LYFLAAANDEAVGPFIPLVEGGFSAAKATILQHLSDSDSKVW